MKRCEKVFHCKFCAKHKALLHNNSLCSTKFTFLYAVILHVFYVTDLAVNVILIWAVGQAQCDITCTTLIKIHIINILYVILVLLQKVVLPVEREIS